jgi:predicted DNA-binding protein
MERLQRGEYPRYQPQLSNEAIHELWKLKEQTGRPMTVLLEEAVRKYVAELTLDGARDAGETPATHGVELQKGEEARAVSGQPPEGKI